MRLPYLSYSQVRKYEYCPAQFMYEYGMGLWPPMTKALDTGKVVHAMIADWHLKGGGQPLATKDGELLRAYTRLSKPSFDRFGNEPLVEWKFMVPLYYPGTAETIGVPVKGVIDLVQDNFIIDHKTSASPYDQDKVDDDLQASIYSYAYRFVTNRIERGVRFNIIVKRARPFLQKLETTRTEADHAVMYDRVREMATRILSDQFPPTGDPLKCKMCYHARICKQGMRVNRRTQ